MCDIRAIKQDMDAGDPNAIDQAYAQPIKEVFTAAGFGDNAGAKCKYCQPEHEFNIFRYERYGSERHYQTKGRQLKNDFPVHVKGVYYKGEKFAIKKLTQRLIIGRLLL
jgi:hypothetical protein